MRKPRIEIVKSLDTSRYTEAGMNYQTQYHGRVREANGEISWTTETMKRKGSVKRAIARLLALPKNTPVIERDET